MPAPRLVLAYDGSPASIASVAAAGRLLPGAEALVVAVAEDLAALDRVSAGARAALPDDVIRTGIGRLRAAALEGAQEHAAAGAEAARAAGLDATARAIEADGAVCPALLEVVRESRAELIVCGSSGHGALARALLGSAATALLYHATVPVLVVPAESGDDGGPVVLGHDGSEHADRAIDAVAVLLAGAEVVIAHAWTSGLRHTLTGRALAGLPLRELREIVAAFDEEQAQTEGAATELAAQRARELDLAARARCEESEDPAAEVLLRVAEEEHAAAIAVGRRGRTALKSALLGSVSTSLTHAAQRPVLVVP